MDMNIHAREAQMRAISIYTLRPECAQVVNRGTAHVDDGLCCTFEQDGHQLTIDMPAAIGGSDKGHAPGYFGRAALSSCVAIGIKMTALRDGVHLDSVTVGIEQDWDNRGLLTMPGASPVPSETRISIQIASPEQPEVVADMVKRALAHDPWLLAFQDAQPVATAVSISKGVA